MENIFDGKKHLFPLRIQSHLLRIFTTSHYHDESVFLDPQTSSCHNGIGSLGFNIIRGYCQTQLPRNSNRLSPFARPLLGSPVYGPWPFCSALVEVNSHWFRRRIPVFTGFIRQNQPKKNSDTSKIWIEARLCGFNKTGVDVNFA